jgi:hypothetical protein
MNRDCLHSLVDRIPEADLLAARRFLEYLIVSPAFRATQMAPLDDEEVTRADEEAMADAQADVDAGRITAHEDLLREFGLR